MKPKLSLFFSRAHSIKVKAYPNPGSKQLILDSVYEIKIEIFDKDEQAIYPSEVNIYDLIFIDEYFLCLKIKAEATFINGIPHVGEGGGSKNYLVTSFLNDP